MPGMTRWLLWILVGVLLGGVVHLVAILLLPSVASRNAYSRLADLTPVNVVSPLAAPAPGSDPLPYMDPAFATSVCRYDLSNGPLKLSVPVTQAYTSVSFYSSTGVAYYALNDRAAGRTIIELDLMTSEQHADLPENEEETAADRLIVESPTPTGVIVIRALAPEAGLMPAVRDVLARARCTKA